MKLLLEKRDIALRIVQSMVADKLPVQSFSEASSLEIGGKRITETFAISMAVFKEFNFGHLLGSGDEEATGLFQCSLQAESDWKIRILKDRDGAIAVFGF